METKEISMASGDGITPYNFYPNYQSDSRSSFCADNESTNINSDNESTHSSSDHSSPASDSTSYPRSAQKRKPTKRATRRKGANKNDRMIYTDGQSNRLAEAFEDNKYPDTALIERLSIEINAPKRKVQIWFQNARAKMRKTDSGKSLLNACSDAASKQSKTKESKKEASSSSTQSKRKKKLEFDEDIETVPPRTSIPRNEQPTSSYQTVGTRMHQNVGANYSYDTNVNTPPPQPVQRVEELRNSYQTKNANTTSAVVNNTDNMHDTTTPMYSSSRFPTVQQFLSNVQSPSMFQMNSPLIQACYSPKKDEERVNLPSPSSVAETSRLLTTSSALLLQNYETSVYDYMFPTF